MPDPSWQELVTGEIEHMSQGRETRSHGGAATNVRLPIFWGRLVSSAAKKRGLTRSSYMRRAIMAFTVYDLEMDWDDLMHDEPGIRPFDHHGAPTRVQGRLFGPWRITGMRE